MPPLPLPVGTSGVEEEPPPWSLLNDDDEEPAPDEALSGARGRSMV